MMPTVRRLKTRPQFLEVAAARRKWVAPGLILQAKCRAPSKARDGVACRNSTRADGPGGNEDGEVVRIGFTVSRKVGNAVQRNRARRRLRAVAGEILPVEGKAGFDYVLIGRAATLDRDFRALREDLRTALAGVAKDKRRQRPVKTNAGPGAAEATAPGKDVRRG